MRTSIRCPSTSVDEYPNNTSAARLNNKILPLLSIITIASPIKESISWKSEPNGNRGSIRATSGCLTLLFSIFSSLATVQQKFGVWHEIIRPASASVRQIESIRPSSAEATPGERVVKGIRRATRRQFSTEEKMRIVLDGLRGEDSITDLCWRGGLGQSSHHVWSKEFLEADNPSAGGRHRVHRDHR